MGRVLEGFWDCSYCGNKHISGLKKSCPSCGRVRDETTKFYMDGTGKERELTDEQLSSVGSGPDWLCAFCGSYNSSDIEICKSCGHSRDEEDRDYFEQQRVNEEKARERREYELRVTGERQYSTEGQQEPTGVASGIGGANTGRETVGKEWDTRREGERGVRLGRGTNFNLTKALPILGVILLVLLGIFLLVPKATTLTVDKLTWDYAIQIEELKTFNESDWQMPAGARLQHTSTEIHHYDQVLDHMETKTRQVPHEVLDGYDEVVTGYTDNGNGTFIANTTQVPRYRTEYTTETYQEPVYRDEPVYATKYYYEIDRWTRTRAVTTSGIDKSPYYGEVILADKEREGVRSEDYTLYCHNEKGKEFEYTITKEEWEKLNVGENINAKVNAIGDFELIEGE